MAEKSFGAHSETGTDQNGQLHFHGFWGEYDLEITTLEGKQIRKTFTHFPKTPNNIIVSL